MVADRAAAGASLQTFAGLVFSAHSLEGSQQRKEMEGLDFRFVAGGAHGGSGMVGERFWWKAEFCLGHSSFEIKGKC